MKKIVLFLGFICSLAFVGIYIIIPSKLYISESVKVQSSVAGTYRNLSNVDNWDNWWPAKHSLQAINANNLPIFDNNTFSITKLLYNDLEITVHSISGGYIKSTLLFIPLTTSTFSLNWNYEVKTSINPFERIAQYRRAVKTKQQIVIILRSIQVFFSKTENIYGISIIETSTTDTLLISASTLLNAHPSTSDVYKLISQLQTYIVANDAKQTGKPMLNISKLNNNTYKTMVAIPINKSFPTSGDIVYKRMIPGAFLVTTVKGGNGNITLASQQIQQYFLDYKRVPAAIPFQILITNRSFQKDTANWITRLYFPVMN